MATEVWYEVFRKNEDESTETIFRDESLEKCAKFYRKQKRKDKTLKLDKWMDAPFLDFPQPVALILE